MAQCPAIFTRVGGRFEYSCRRVSPVHHTSLVLNDARVLLSPYMEQNTWTKLYRQSLPPLRFYAVNDMTETIFSLRFNHFSIIFMRGHFHNMT